MKRSLYVATTVTLLAASLAGAQTPPPSTAAPATGTAPAQKSIASTMSVYVFPNGGQDASMQSKDEGECYNWAVQNTGTDPFALQKQAQAQQQQTQAQKDQIAKSGGGAGAAGAVKGAAAGALIGEIANDDAGQGAAYGAAVGVVAGRRKARKAKEQATAQTEQQGQQAQAATAQQLDGFKKAFSVCLEAKKYMVKY
jgi:hypothetical protein